MCLETKTCNSLINIITQINPIQCEIYISIDFYKLEWSFWSQEFSLKFYVFSELFSSVSLLTSALSFIVVVKNKIQDQRWLIKEFILSYSSGGPVMRSMEMGRKSRNLRYHNLKHKHLRQREQTWSGMSLWTSKPVQSDILHLARLHLLKIPQPHSVPWTGNQVIRYPWRAFLIQTTTLCILSNQFTFHLHEVDFIY